MTPNGDERRAPLWPFLLLCAALAAWVDLGNFHREDDSDAVVPVLTSLYHWTPFYWETSRIGMLLPLLAAPVRSPLSNLLFQAWMALFATFGMFYLLPRYLVRGPGWAHAGSLALLTFLLLLPRGTRFCFTFGMPHYGVSAALGLGALLLAGPGAGVRERFWRLPLAALLVVLGNWVNSSLPAVLGPLVVLRPLLVGPWRGWRRPVDAELAWGLGLVLLGVLFTAVIKPFFPSGPDPMAGGFLPAGEWPGAWYKLTLASWQAVADPYWAINVRPADELAETLPPLGRAALGLALVAAALAGLARSLWRRQYALPCAAAALLITGIAFGSVIGSTRWVAITFHCKYWIPTVFAAVAALGALAAGVLTVRSRAARLGALVALAAALPLTAGLHYGRPSRGGVRHDLLAWNGGAVDPARPLAGRPADLLDSRCTHLCGSYWDVWMAVFQANQLLHERGEDRIVWGTAYRALASWDDWGGWPSEGLRVAVCDAGGKPDVAGELALRLFFPETTLVERRPTLWVYRPATEVPATRPKPTPEGPAVRAAWHGGFYWGAPINRVCRGRGLLTLTNTSDRPVRVTLSADVQTMVPGPATLWVEGAPFSTRLAVDAPLTPLGATFVLPPGSRTLAWSSDARPDEGTPGCSVQIRTVFRVTSFRLAEEPAEAVSPVSSGRASR